MAVKSFRRWCGIRNLLKCSSFAAGEETKQLPLLGMGLFGRFGATGPGQPLGRLGPLWMWGEPEGTSVPSCSITGEEPQAGY